MFMDELVRMDHLSYGLHADIEQRNPLARAMKNQRGSHSLINAAANAANVRSKLARGYALMMGESDDAAGWKNIESGEEICSSR